MSAYNQMANADVESGPKPEPGPLSVFLQRHTCPSCGKSSEREIDADTMMHHHALYHPYHPPRSAWHAPHTQTTYYTMNVLLVAIVIFLTFFAAKFLYGR